MTETHPTTGRIPTGPVNLSAGIILALLAATQLTPDQVEHLVTLLSIPGTVHGLAVALNRT